MARTFQKLINYHTSNAATMPNVEDVSFGEIVVRHNIENPQLLIKVDSAGTEVFVPFIASGAISTAIEARVTDAVGTINASIAELSGSVESFSGAVIENYMTSADTIIYVESAITVANEYADSQDEALSGRIMTYISSGVTADITALEERVDNLETFSGLVETDYATKAYADSAASWAIETVQGNDSNTSADTTVNGAKKYTDEKVKELSGNVISYVDGKDSTTKATIETLSGSVVQLSGSVESMSADMKTYIDTELATVYTYKGSVADMTALQAVSNPEVGDVYNVVAAVGQPGDENYTPAGTNYAWVGESSEGAGDAHWDALGGVVDLSNYATTATTDGLQNQIDTINSKIAGATGDVSGLSATVATFSATVESDYATKTYVDDADTAAKIASSAYTDSQIQMLSGITSAYVASQLTTVNSDLSDLKAFTANTAATHDEVATQSAATFESAYTAAVASAQSYTDTKVSDAVTTLKGTASESGDTFGELEAAINTLNEKLGTDTGELDERLTTVEGKLNNSASTWNNAIQGAEFGAVSSSDDNYSGGDDRASGQHASGAGLKYAEGGNIVLDLSGLIVDCGDF